MVSSDPAHPVWLTASGKLQARRLGVQLAGIGIDLALATRLARIQQTVHTVNSHARSIYSRLGARDRVSAVQLARELRLFGPAATKQRGPRRAQSPDPGGASSLGVDAGWSRDHPARPVRDPH
jgi:hypothetical protein